MPRVVSHSEIEAVAPGGTLRVDEDAILTPLALDLSRSRGVQIVRGSPIPPASIVRQVARQVVDKMPGADPAVLEAVITEVVGSISNASGDLEEVGPGIDYCQMCIEQERSRHRARAVLTTTGRNQKGIVARVTAKIAELGGDILDISQTLVGDYFTMIIIVDAASPNVPFAEFKDTLEHEVREMGLNCMMMHEDVVSSLHRV